jgi:hypothetical protein
LIDDSDQEIMRVAREKRNKMFGFKTRDDYYNELKKHIELDPLNYEANFLRKISQPAHILEMNDNHFWAIVKTWLFYQDFVVKSFQ